MSNIDWVIHDKLVTFEQSIAFMQSKIDDISNNKCNECISIWEYTEFYTIGRGTIDRDVISHPYLHTYYTGHGGTYGYHGPGQRIIAVMLDIRKHRLLVSKYVGMLEDWMIRSLNKLDVPAFTIDKYPGVWTNHNGNIKKLVSIALHVDKGITSYGCCLNINPDLSKYDYIIPCNITEYGVTSLLEIDKHISTQEIDNILQSTWCSPPDR